MGDEQVAGGLCGPCSGGVRGDASEEDLTGLHLDEEQDVIAAQERGVDGEEVTRDSGLGVQELGPGHVGAVRGRDGERLNTGFYKILYYRASSTLDVAALQESPGQSIETGDMARVSKRQQRSTDMRSKILAAARALILEFGSTEFAMAELADAAGVALVTPYNHFDSKAGVLAALLDLEHAQANAREYLDDAGSDDGLAMLEAFGRSRCEIYAAESGLFRPVLAGLFTLDPPSRLGPVGRQLAVNLWRRGFDVAADHGDLRAGLDLELVAAKMHNLFAAALRSWSLDHHDDDLLRADTDFAIGLVVVSVVAEPRRSEWIDRMADAQARVVVASRRALVDQRVSEDSSARL